MKCMKCNYDWIPKVYRPKECPQCKTRDYWENNFCFICNKIILINNNIHHINGNHNDNRTINLLPVCKTCHTLVHHVSKKTLNIERKDKQRGILIKKYQTLLYLKSKKFKNKDL